MNRKCNCNNKTFMKHIHLMYLVRKILLNISLNEVLEGGDDEVRITEEWQVLINKTCRLTSCECIFDNLQNSAELSLQWHLMVSALWQLVLWLTERWAEPSSAQHEESPVVLKRTHMQNRLHTPPPAILNHLTCASLCWLSASPGEISACLASWMRSAEPSITSRAESSMAAAALGSVVEAATPRAAWASVFRAWAVSLAAIPTHGIRDKKDNN